MNKVDDVRVHVDAKEFGQRLRELREANGFSRLELAERLDITVAAIGNWEQGTRRPQFPEEVIRISAVLGVEVSELLIMPSKDSQKKRGRGRPKKSDDE